MSSCECHLVPGLKNSQQTNLRGYALNDLSIAMLIALVINKFRNLFVDAFRRG